MKTAILVTCCLLASCANAPQIVNPKNLELEADSSWQVDGNTRYLSGDKPYNGPIGRLSLHMDVPVSESLNFRYGIEHRSFIETSIDRGDERAFVGLKWRPFARK